MKPTTAGQSDSSGPIDSVISSAELRQRDREIGSLKSQIVSLRSTLKLTSEERDHAERALAALTELPDVEPNANPVAKHKATGTATALFGWSDWHVEERVDREKVNGLNHVRPNIIEKRVHRLVDRCLWMLEKQRKVTTIKDAVLWWGGDFINGNIHDENLENNCMLVTEAVLFARQLLADSLATLAKHAGLDRITVVCNYGNHGRFTKKPRIATGAGNSFETLIYKTLACQIGNSIGGSGTKGKGGKSTGGVAIDWRIADGEHVLVDVQGHVCRFQHGDALKYNGGVGGLLIPLGKAIAAWNEGVRADIDFMGHWHQMVPGRKIIVNGSLVGYDEFALRIKAKYEPPTQIIAIIDRKYGVTSCEPIFLEEPTTKTNKTKIGRRVA